MSSKDLYELFKTVPSTLGAAAMSTKSACKKWAASSSKGKLLPENADMDRVASTNSLSSEGSSDSPRHSDHQSSDILGLTNDVRAFTMALSRLKEVFSAEREKDVLKVQAHECLGHMLKILMSVLVKHPALNSQEMLISAKALIQLVKGFNYEDDSTDPSSSFFEAIDNLALAFGNRVSEYLMADIDVFTNLLPAIQSDTVSTEASPDPFSKEGSLGEASSTDDQLMKLSEGVDLALHRAKIWSKYAKDVLSYIEKRLHFESEYAKNISKLAQAVQPCLKEESFLPFQSVYCTAVDQDIKNASRSYAMCLSLLGPKFIEPLSARRSEHEKTRKQIKETWNKELRKMHEARANLQKAKSLYIQRHQEYERAKETADKAECAEDNKAEKKRKMEEDAAQKTKDAETTYKGWIIEANERQRNLEKVKRDVLRQVRELIRHCDETMKSVTLAFFQMQQENSSHPPLQWQSLYEASKMYEPGSQYAEFVRRLALPESAHNHPYIFEPYLSDRSGRPERKGAFSGDSCEEDIRISDKGHIRVIKSWATNRMLASDSDSSTKSQDASPTASPRLVPTRSAFSSSGDELEICGDYELSHMSKAAESHSFQKPSSPSICKECDTSVYIQGYECSKCGVVCHRRCLESLSVACSGERADSTREDRRTRPHQMFGVNLDILAQRTGQEVPPLISKCVAEIERRAIHIKGIYRISGVKSKVENLCQNLESTGPDSLDLSDVPPHVITSLLKLYLRQLPEPLLTYQYYPEFIRIAKESHSMQEKDVVRELQSLVDSLPSAHASTLAFLIHHLRRVADNQSENNMPPSNLGIVFGPTLLRTEKSSGSGSGPSLNSLVDTVHQTRVVELLINNAPDLLDLPQTEEPAPSDVRHLPTRGKLQRTHRRLFPHYKESQQNAAPHSDDEALDSTDISTKNEDPKRESSVQNTPSSSPGVSETSQSSTGGGGPKSTTEDDDSTSLPPVAPPRKVYQSVSGTLRSGSSEPLDHSTSTSNLRTSASALTAERRRLFFESAPTAVLDVHSLQHLTSGQQTSSSLLSSTMPSTSTGSEEVTTGTTRMLGFHSEFKSESSLTRERLTEQESGAISKSFFRRTFPSVDDPTAKSSAAPGEDKPPVPQPRQPRFV